MKDTQKSGKSTTATKKKAEGFTDEERAAIKERVRETKAVADKADGEGAVLASIAAMAKPVARTPPELRMPSARAFVTASPTFHRTPASHHLMRADAAGGIVDRGSACTLR